MRGDSRTGDEPYVGYVTARLPALQRAAFLLCGGDAHQADDVVQATITRLYQHWKRVSRSDNVDAYVHRMLVHAVIDSKRHSWSRVQLVGRPPEATGHDPHAGVDERGSLVAALRSLPPRQRAVLVMRFLLDRPIDEVAEALDCSVGTVKSQSSRGLDALRSMLATIEERGHG
ncbi:SigE family RNA polymerase sigma factor [Actinoplanes friuliensis]|jgi:RNA polymerase sigma-70 factor (sigma-E family)|uniref:Putative RNA polymerase ECF-subfamily sigma factor n=1 Tax=Actinoplanes friuliensis DSM 7358 TaxID=1246995 RepID=U5W455_9ACTN|nr:SigE family RNA polymerase sigma factor [Actinoplanes friuliensis]AGZ43914.1 putative RNA polymerase ECF-subfamily sigma factor [Actinoplanes friuliensis DSM 7358]